MIRIKFWVRNFFGFTRSQVNGFIVLLVLVTIFLFSEPIWQWWISSSPRNMQHDMAQLDSLISLWDSLDIHREQQAKVAEQPALFYFNPNMATSEEFLSLGLSPSMATRIIHYREKGGKFNLKSDLLKIYGFDSAFYLRLKPYVNLPEQKIAVRKTQALPTYRKPAIEKQKPVEKFNLNDADTARLKQIYGIGEKLSLRIIKFRDALGGFISMDQLYDVYGLDSAVVARVTENALILNGFRPVQLNLNTASEKQLAAHPYLRKVAGAIVSYRFQHGNFKTVEDIRTVGTLDEQTVQKVISYLKVSDED